MICLVVLKLARTTGTTRNTRERVIAVNENQTLRLLLQEAADVRGLSGRGLADLATSNGFNLNRSTVSRILSGTYIARPANDTIRAVAWLAGVSERVAFEAAGRPQPGPSFVDELPEDADLLTPRERRIVIDLVRVLVENKRGALDEDTSTQNPPSDPPADGEVGPRRTTMKLVKPTDGTDENQGLDPDGMPPFDPRKALAAYEIPDEEASMRPREPTPENESQDPADHRS